ncbi:MAG: hypothetical protein KDK07_13580 [Bauldia sp.]|nr:hypothetical protein [Bauldia sp.]
MAELALLAGVALGLKFRLGLAALASLAVLVLDLSLGTGSDVAPIVRALHAMSIVALAQVTALVVAIAVENVALRAPA